MNTPHWPSPHAAIGAGAHAVLPGDTTVVAAANDVLAYFDTNPCTKASVPPVLAFQSAYNASGFPGSLTVDGEYGPNTQKALQNVIDSVETGMGPTQQASLNCWGEALPATPAPNATTSTTATTSTKASTTQKVSPALIAGVAAITAGGIYAVYRMHKRRG